MALRAQSPRILIPEQKLNHIQNPGDAAKADALQSTDPPELHYGPPAVAEIQEQHSLVKILSGS